MCGYGGARTGSAGRCEIGEITPGNSTVFLIGTRSNPSSGMGFWVMEATWGGKPPNQARKETLQTRRVTSETELALLVGEFALVVHRRGGTVQVAEADAAAGDVVGRHLEADAVARDDSDAALARLAAGIGEHLRAVRELHAELGVRQHLFDGAFHLHHFFLGHG